ncbi:MAG: hypothetical protein IIT46_16950, partial [Lachnospiraceae bacterium]|nr:hypothetical protein [Lachnospiraceae bacterium]
SITDTYCYDAYGNLLQKTGDTENDYLYTGEQYNANKGIVVQTLITCTATALFGELAASILKVVGIAQDTIGFVDAVKTGDPEEIIVAALRLTVSVFTLKCQCFTGDTLVSTEDGDRRIDEIQAGDYVWAYNTETGERELKKVLSTPVTETDILVHVGLSNVVMKTK